jgi:pyruvate formate lyase activating enzyme
MAALAELPARDARYYEELSDQRIRCGLCPRRCVVPDGMRGHCGVRENRKGKYYTLVYGYPVAVNNDPIEKKPLFHVHPGSKAFSIATVGCNIDCKFCQNWDISQAEPDDVKARYTPPEAIAAAAVEASSKVVAYTYNEPTIFYEYMFDCARAASERGIGNVVISNGFIEAAPQKDLLPLLTAYKIDLKAFTQEFYGRICNGHIEPVKASLKRLKDNNIWFEIVVLLIPTLNDSMDDIKRMASWIATTLGPSVPIHFTRFHPMYKLRNLPRTPPKTLRAARKTAMDEGCRFVYVGNLPGNEGSHTYCPDCKDVLIRRYGHMVIANNLKSGACPGCGCTIPGVWS